MASLSAEVPGDHRSVEHRDLQLLAEPRRVQRRRFVADPDRSVPPAVYLLRRRKRLDRQPGRWLQWHWKGADAPGEALNDGEIPAGIFSRLREMYARDGGAVPEQVLNMRWDYLTPDNPAPEEVAQENNGKALADLLDADGKVLVKKASCSARSRSCATTAPPPAAAGSSPAAGRRPATRWRGATTPIRPASAIRWAGHGHGRSTAASCTTAPRRTRRVNRGIRNASCWSGTAPSGSGPISDYSTAAPGSDVGPFIMQPEGMGRLFATDKMAEGPFPEHYEPFETPLGTNPLHPNVVSNPAARVFRTIWRRWANPTSSLTSAPPIV